MKAALIAKITAGVLAAGAAAAVAIVLLQPDGGPEAGQPRAWIDDPLNGSSPPPGPVHVVAHAADPAGIAAMEFAVDDAVQETRDVPGSPTFWLANFDWAAEQAGTVVIRVRARSSTGAWGAPAFAIVHIGGRGSTPTLPPTPPPTQAPPTTTPSVTPSQSSAPPTQPPACTQVVAPDPAAPPNRSTVTTVTPVLDWRYGGPCTPGGFEVQVSWSRAFTEIVRSGTTGGSTTQWTVSPALADCTTYYWRVRAVSAGTTGAWSDPYGFDVAVGRCP